MGDSLNLQKPARNNTLHGIVIKALPLQLRRGKQCLTYTIYFQLLIGGAPQCQPSDIGIFQDLAISLDLS